MKTENMDRATLTRLLDPKDVRPSRWCNRLESSYAEPAFERLKSEIAHAGGNVQPIKVRADRDEGFEIVFGHRRHRACLELGLPVLAMVVDLTDVGLWEQMERENRHRADLSPFEQGRHYNLALDAGLYRSMRRLAEAVGIDVGQVSKVIGLASLPAEVVGAFASPSDMQVNWSTGLNAALQRDPSQVLERARRLATGAGPRLTPTGVFKALTEPAGVESFNTQAVEIPGGAKGPLAVIRRRKSGFSIEINSSIVSMAQLEAVLRQALQA